MSRHYGVFEVGPGIQSRHKYNAEPPEFKGRHLWVFAGCWAVSNPASGHQNFDIENLVTITGPRCFGCEELWYPTIGAHCPGHADE